MKLHQAYKLYLYFILYPDASLHSKIDSVCYPAWLMHPDAFLLFRELSYKDIIVQFQYNFIYIDLG